MDRRIFWLRASYWTGILLGFTASLQMIHSGISFLSGKREVAVFFLVAGFAVLGLSWLLIWGDRQPEQRKGFLRAVLCLVPIAWAGAECIGLAFAGLSLSSRLPHWLLQGALSVLFFGSYLRARQAYPKWWSQRA